MQTIHSERVPKPKPGVKSNCKLVVNQFFISGMVGREADGSIPEGMAAQAARRGGGARWRSTRKSRSAV